MMENLWGVLILLVLGMGFLLVDAGLIRIARVLEKLVARGEDES